MLSQLLRQVLSQLLEQKGADSRGHGRGGRMHLLLQSAESEQYPFCQDANYPKAHDGPT